MYAGTIEICMKRPDQVMGPSFLNELHPVQTHTDIFSIYIDNFDWWTSHFVLIEEGPWDKTQIIFLRPSSTSSSKYILIFAPEIFNVKLNLVFFLVLMKNYVFWFGVWFWCDRCLNGVCALWWILWNFSTVLAIRSVVHLYNI